MEMILDPTIMFFCLGVLAVWVKSNIEIPPETVKFLSYYLLLSIGFKGGISLAKAEFTSEILWTLGAGMIAAVIIPIWLFLVLRKKLDAQNAAAAAACYGAGSAVTFLTASSWLENQGASFGGHMVAMMALIECPAIMMALLIPKLFKDKNNTAKPLDIKEILHDSFFNGSVFLLIGSLLIGYFMNPAKAHDYQVFIYDIFKGFLCFFLFDLGMMAARQVKLLKSNALFLSCVAFGAPLVNATFGLLIARMLGLDVNNGFIFMVIFASASYIGVPAALKANLPEASPSIYLSMSLGLTFPFNILLGLPLYWQAAKFFLV